MPVRLTCKTKLRMHASPKSPSTEQLKAAETSHYMVYIELARLIVYPVVRTNLEFKPLLEGPPLSSTVDTTSVTYTRQIHIRLHFPGEN